MFFGLFFGWEMFDVDVVCSLLLVCVLCLWCFCVVCLCVSCCCACVFLCVWPLVLSVRYVYSCALVLLLCVLLVLCVFVLCVLCVHVLCVRWC